MLALKPFHPGSRKCSWPALDSFSHVAQHLPQTKVCEAIRPLIETHRHDFWDKQHHGLQQCSKQSSDLGPSCFIQHPTGQQESLLDNNTIQQLETWNTSSVGKSVGSSFHLSASGHGGLLLELRVLQDVRPENQKKHTPQAPPACQALQSVGSFFPVLREVYPQTKSAARN